MIEIVTHCYAARFPHYAKALRYHLSGPLHHPPQVPVTFKVCYTHEDVATRDVLDEFAKYNSAAYHIVRLPLPLDLLGRRHYGRDVAAAGTKADLVWMADCDYYFGRDCLDTLHRVFASAKGREAVPGMAPRPVLWWPRHCMVSTDHAIGDGQLARAGVGVVAPQPDIVEFSRMRFPRAIGGTFILDGDYARDVGYLRGGKWVPPWKEDGVPPFASTRCDVSFRQRIKKHGVAQALDLPELYRLRHSETAVCNEAYRLESQMGD